MTDEMEKFIKGLEEMLDLIHSSTTIEAVELSNENKIMLYAIFEKNSRTPQGGYNKPWSGGGGNFPKLPQINIDGLNPSSYDLVTDFLLDAKFTKEVKQGKDGSDWVMYKAKSEKGDTISASYSDNKKSWYFKYYDKELKSYEFVNKNYSDEMEKVMICCDVINNREIQNSVLGKIKNDGKATEQKLEDMEG